MKRSVQDLSSSHSEREGVAPRAEHVEGATRVPVIDARGLSCPQPVILASKAIDEGKFPIEVLVDTVTARENVRRISENKGLKVAVEEENDEFKLTIGK